MHEDIFAARRSIAALGATKYLRRYPAALRAQLVRLVRAHPESSVRAIATAIDIAPKTLQRFVGGSGGGSAIVPVRVVAEARPSKELRVHGPHGIVVDGLDVDGVAELIRALA